MILLFDVMLSYLLNPHWKPLCTECVDLFCDNVGHLFSKYWERLHTFIQWQPARCSFLWWHTGYTSLLIIIATWPKGNIWQRTSKVACSASTFTINILSCLPVSRAVHVSCCVFVMCILTCTPRNNYSPCLIPLNLGAQCSLQPSGILIWVCLAPTTNQRPWLRFQGQPKMHHFSFNCIFTLVLPKMWRAVKAGFSMSTKFDSWRNWRSGLLKKGTKARSDENWTG